MSDSRQGDSVEGKIAPKKRVRSKARYTRSKELFPRLSHYNSFTLSDGFIQDAITLGYSDLALFRYNCRYICHRRAYSFNTLMSELNRVGVTISRTSMLGRNPKNTFPKSLLLSTFALALGVPTWLLLSDNIELDSQRLKVF
jgi:hypothetical protein